MPEAKNKRMLFLLAAAAFALLAIAGLLLKNILATGIFALLFAAALSLSLLPRKGQERELAEKKTRLGEDIRIAEQRFFEGRIDKETFESLLTEKQAELVALEAKIKGAERGSASVEDLGDVQPKKKHLLRALFDQKALLESELRIAEKKYLKRQLDTKTFENIEKKKQRELIDIESQIKTLFSEQSTEEIMEELASKLKSIDRQKKG